MAQGGRGDCWEKIHPGYFVGILGRMAAPSPCLVPLFIPRPQGSSVLCGRKACWADPSFPLDFALSVYSSSSWGGGACGIAFRQCRLHPFPKGVHGSGARTRRVQEGAPGWLVREEGWGRRASLVSGIVGAGASPCLLPTAARGEPFRSILSVRNRALELTRAGPPEICGGSEPSCLCAGHS